ncbi:MAG: hypothetical protein AB1630_01160 [bacterium]
MKERIIQQGWDVEDAFFGALLGAVFGIVIQEKEWYIFPILIAFLGVVVFYLKKHFTLPKGLKRQRAIGKLLMGIILTSISLWISGVFTLHHSSWLGITIIVWVILKFIKN